MKITPVAIFVVALIPGAAYSGGNYDYFQATYFSGTDESLGVSIDTEGITLAGSISAFDKNIFAIQPSFSQYTATIGAYDLTQTAFGVDVVAHQEIATQIRGEIFAGIASLDVSTSPALISDSDTGKRFGMAVKGNPSDKVELGLSLTRESAYGSSENITALTAVMHLNDKVSAIVGYETQQDLDGFSVGIRIR